MDYHGRLADSSPVRAAGWRPGQPITLTVSRSPALVIINADGPDKITSSGHLQLPAKIRRICTLSTGERLFVAVTTRPVTLTVYPMATIEVIINQQRQSTLRTEIR
ncbi:MAG: hypothetical protein AB7V44_09765 [Pseudonocardia sp.]